MFLGMERTYFLVFYFRITSMHTYVNVESNELISWSFTLVLTSCALRRISTSASGSLKTTAFWKL